MATFSEIGSGGCEVSGISYGTYAQAVFFPQTRSVRKGVCHSKDKIPKATVIAMYPDGSATKTWLQGLSDDQWTVTSFNALNRQVCIDVVATSSEILHTLTLTLPAIV